MQILHLSISTETNKNSQINDSVLYRDKFRNSLRADDN